MSAIVIPGAVPPEIVARIRALMERGPLVSGKLTAVGRAKDIKENLMLPPDSAASLRHTVMATSQRTCSEASPIIAPSTWSP